MYGPIRRTLARRVSKGELRRVRALREQRGGVICDERRFVFSRLRSMERYVGCCGQTVEAGVDSSAGDVHHRLRATVLLVQRETYRRRGKHFLAARAGEGARCLRSVARERYALQFTAVERL